MLRKSILFMAVSLLWAVAAFPRTVYCSSSSGNDLNRGTSGAPVRTIAKAVKMGDKVMLRRGDTFYEQVEVDGVSIDAYGSGDNPVVSGLKIPTKRACWTRGMVAGGTWVASPTGNVWKISLLDSKLFTGVDTEGKASLLNNVGAIVNLTTRSLNDSRKLQHLSDLNSNYDFYQEGCTHPGLMKNQFNDLYLYLDSDPSQLPLGFTCGLNGVTASNCTVHNITVEFWGRHGFSIGDNTTLDNCRIDGIGGAASLAKHWSLLGNGIESWVTPPGRKNITVKNCVVSRCYDCGMTIQGHNDKAIPVYNSTFTNNYVYNCGQAWEGVLNSDAGAECTYYNCAVEGNYFVDNGRDTGFRYNEKWRSKYCQLLSTNFRPSGLIVRNNFMADGDYICCNKTSTGLFDPFVLQGNVVYIVRGQNLLINGSGRVKVTVPLASDYPTAEALRAATDRAIEHYRQMSGDQSTRFVVVDSQKSASLLDVKQQALKAFGRLKSAQQFIRKL